MDKFEFIEKAHKVHNGKFDYSQVVFLKVRDKVDIICKKHGVFKQSVYDHLKGHGCPKCAHEKLSYSTDVFIEKAKKIHGEKYDYTKTEFNGFKNKILITCPEHGDFYQTPSCHLKGNGCSECAREKLHRPSKRKKSLDTFLKECKEVHSDKYDYSKVEYVDDKTKVCIICPEHGEFWQKPNKHLMGQGCKACGRIRTINASLRRNSNFVNKIKVIFGDKYDYSKVEYKKAKINVCLVCKKHGDFYARPDHLLSGHGCPLCRESTMERSVRVVLIENNIEHIQEYHNVEILNKQSLDFFIPSKNIGIECQGEQHFKENFYKIFSENSSSNLEYVKQLDERKKKLCRDNNIHLIYYLPPVFAEYMSDDDIYFTDVNELVDYIKNYKLNE